MKPTLHVLPDVWTPDLAKPLDGLLAAARPQLVGPSDHLETAWERVTEAQIDPDRLLFIACMGDELAGFIDARMHNPEPGDITIKAIAVAPSFRFRGLATTLVHRVIHQGEQRLALPLQFHASVLPSATGAYDFWTSLGWTAVRAGQFVYIHPVETD